MMFNVTSTCSRISLESTAFHHSLPYTQQCTPTTLKCSSNVRAVPRDARDADRYRASYTYKPKDARQYPQSLRRRSVRPFWLLRIIAEKPPNQRQNRVPQNAVVMPLNQSRICVLYRARSLVLVKVGELLLEHVEEVLPVRHLMRGASAYQTSALNQILGADSCTSGAPHSTTSLWDRIALDLVVCRWVF